MLYASWSARHGDTSKTAVWAVLDDLGASVDLSQWVVRAQLRQSKLADIVDAVFTTAHGINIGQTTLSLDSGVVTTSTVQLYLDPVDWTVIPEAYTGILDVEMASDTTATPLEVHTLVEVSFTVDEDVTRA